MSIEQMIGEQSSDQSGSNKSDMDTGSSSKQIQHKREEFARVSPRRFAIDPAERSNLDAEDARLLATIATFLGG